MLNETIPNFKIIASVFKRDVYVPKDSILLKFRVEFTAKSKRETPPAHPYVISKRPGFLNLEKELQDRIEFKIYEDLQMTKRGGSFFQKKDKLIELDAQQEDFLRVNEQRFEPLSQRVGWEFLRVGFELQRAALRNPTRQRTLTASRRDFAGEVRMVLQGEKTMALYHLCEEMKYYNPDMNVAQQWQNRETKKVFSSDKPPPIHKLNKLKDLFCGSAADNRPQLNSELQNHNHIIKANIWIRIHPMIDDNIIEGYRFETAKSYYHPHQRGYESTSLMHDINNYVLKKIFEVLSTGPIKLEKHTYSGLKISKLNLIDINDKSVVISCDNLLKNCGNVGRGTDP